MCFGLNGAHTQAAALYHHCIDTQACLVFSHTRGAGQYLKAEVQSSPQIVAVRELTSAGMMSKAVAPLSTLMLALESLQVYRAGVNHCFSMSWLARRAYIRVPLINQEFHSESFEVNPSRGWKKTFTWQQRIRFIYICGKFLHIFRINSTDCDRLRHFSVINV